MSLKRAKGVIRHFKEEGWTLSLRRAFKEASTPIHRREEYFFYTMFLDDPLARVATKGNPSFRLATIDDVPRLDPVMYMSKEEVTQWLIKGQLCFYVTVGDEIASYGWVGPRVTPLGPLGDLWAYLPEGEAFAHTMRTLPAFRGMSLYPFTLVKMGEHLSNTGFMKLWGFSAPHNVASDRGLAKAGFVKTGKVTYQRFLGREEFVLQGEVQWIKEGRSGKFGEGTYRKAAFVDGPPFEE